MIQRTWTLLVLVCTLGIFSYSSGVAQAPTSAIPATIPPNAAATPTTPTTVEGYKSLFFDNETVEVLHALRAKHAEALLQGLDIPLEEKTSAPQAAGPINTQLTYPQFFMSSMVYHHPNEWALWINNTKFTPANTTGLAGLEVISVNADQAQLRFSAPETTPIEFKGSDANTRTISFTLKPNQTFTTASMKVIEGRVNPTVIAISANQKVIDKLKKEEGSIADIFSAPSPPPSPSKSRP